MTAATISSASHCVGEGPERPLERALRELHPGASWNQVRRVIESGKVDVDGKLVTDPRFLVETGQLVRVRMNAPRANRLDDALPERALVHVDRSIVVVDKPAGISTVPYEDERDSLCDRVTALLARRGSRRGAPLGVVHRLDKGTSGSS